MIDIRYNTFMPGWTPQGYEVVFFDEDGHEQHHPYLSLPKAKYFAKAIANQCPKTVEIKWVY